MRSFKKPLTQKPAIKRPARRQMPIKEIINRLDEAVSKELAAEAQEPEETADDNR